MTPSVSVLLGLVALLLCQPVIAAAYDPSVWLGQYSTSGCDQSTCCCMTSVSITSSASSQYTISGPVSGACGFAQGTTVSASYPPPTSDYFQYTFNGQTHIDVRNGNTITDTNTAASQCSATLTKSSGGATNGACSGSVCDSASNKNICSGISYCCPTSGETPSGGSFNGVCSVTCSVAQTCTNSGGGGAASTTGTFSFYSDYSCTTLAASTGFTVNECQSISAQGNTASFKASSCNNGHFSGWLYGNGDATCSGSQGSNSYSGQPAGKCLPLGSSGSVFITCADGIVNSATSLNPGVAAVLSLVAGAVLLKGI